MKSLEDNLHRLTVLVSGNGTNLQAIIDACQSSVIPAEVCLVVSNNPSAYGLTRAKEADIATEIVLPEDNEKRADYDARLAEIVAGSDPDIVVLAGWNRLLTSTFLSTQIVVNLHPALPGTFPGLGAIEKAYAAWQADEIDHSGIMVHYVPDEGVDDGPVIMTEKVAFVDDDSLEQFEQRMHAAEHKVLVAAICQALEEMHPS